jgi:hypothetical protein
MVNLKPRSNTAAKPKPKYGHLSQVHPDWATLKDAADKNFEQLWKLPFEDFKKEWDTFPPALVEDSPVVDKDITIEHVKVPARDGTQIEIRIYKHIKPVQNALLNLNCHGGGMLNQFERRMTTMTNHLGRMGRGKPRY